MEQEEEKIEEVTEQKQININDLPLEKLKSVAFDLNEQINSMRRQYNQIYELIVKKSQEEKQNGNE